MKVNTDAVISAFADESSQNFDEQLDAVCRNGITHLEIREIDGGPVHKLSLDDIRLIKSKADDAGVQFSAVASGLGKSNLDDDMDEQVAMCRHIVDIAHILETPIIRIFSFHVPEDRSLEDCRQQVIDNLGMFIDVVRGSGIILAHENEKNIYGERAEQCLELHEAFQGTGLFKGVFDFANFVQAGQDPLTDCWPLLKAYTAYFHIKDAFFADRRVVPAGQGEAHVREVLADALRSGFNSFLSVEPHLWPRYFEGNSAERFDLAVKGLLDLLAELSAAL